MRIILLIFIFSVGTIILFFKKDKEIVQTNNTEIQKKVEVKIFEKLEFTKKIKLRGFSQASRVVTIKSQVDGRISSKQFQKGEFYKAGTQLILIDPEDKIAKVKEMEALLNQRKKEYEVSESLYKKGFRSEVKLSQSRTNFENALALFEKSQVALNNTKVTIPFDSAVEESYVELGDYLKKGDSIVKIIDLSPLFIQTSANEKQIKNIILNQNATVFINDKKVDGFVNYISKTSDPNTRNFTIQVKIENENYKILSGLSSEIQIQGIKQNAFYVPSSLVTLNNLGKIGIKIIENQRVKFIPIDILSDTGSGYWINSRKIKLDNQISIITQGQDFTIEGEKVMVIKNND